MIFECQPTSLPQQARDHLAANFWGIERFGQEIFLQVNFGTQLNEVDNSLKLLYCVQKLST